MSRVLIKPLLKCISIAQLLNPNVSTSTATVTVLTSFHSDLYTILASKANQLYSMAHRYIEQHHTIIEVDTATHPLDPKMFSNILYQCGVIYMHMECYVDAITYFEEVLTHHTGQTMSCAAYKKLLLLHLVVYNKEYQVSE